MATQRLPRQPGIDPAKPVRYRRIPVPDVSGGGGTTGHLRWGPNFGNDEQHNFGAVGSISLAEYRAIVAYLLTAEESITLIGDIQAQFGLTAQEALSIFFTLVFLYTEIVQGDITISAISQIGLLLEQSGISISALQTAYSLTAQEALSIFFTLTFLYTVIAQGSITMPALSEIGLLVEQTVLTGSFAPLYNLFSTAAIRETALALAGALQGQGSVLLSAVQVGSLQLLVNATLAVQMSPVYTLIAAGAIRMVALQEVGLLQEATTISGSVNPGYTDAVAAAIRMPALQELGLLQVADSVNLVALQEAGQLQAAASISLTLSNFLVTLNAVGSINMVALQEAGQLNAVSTLMGSFGPGYTLAAAGAVRQPALSEVGLLQMNGILTGALASAYSALGVAGAIRQPALSGTGLLSEAGTLSGAYSVDYLRQLLVQGSSTGLTAWFDATRINQSDNTSVVTWSDVSGNGNDISQGVGASQPTFHTPWRNSRPGVTFDGGDALQSLPVFLNGTSGSIFAVVAPSSATGAQVILSSADNASNSRFIQLYTFKPAGAIANRIAISQRNNDTADACNGDTELDGGVWHILEWHSDGAAWELRVDGVVQTLTVASGANTGDWFGDTSARDNIDLGAVTILSGTTNIFTGDMAEILCFDAVTLSAQTKTDWRNYLAQKWSIPGVTGQTGWGWDPIAKVSIASLALDLMNEQVAAAASMPALAEVGLTQLQAAADMVALQELGLMQASGAFGLTYVLTYNGGASGTADKTFNLTVPNGVTAFSGEAWAGGGTGGQAGSTGGGGGGGGSPYVKVNSVATSAGSTLKVNISAAAAQPGTAGDSWVSTTTVAPTGVTQGCLSKGATSGATGTTSQGAGGAAGPTASSIGDTKNAGGAGGGGGGVGTLNGGGGGGSGGRTGAGGAGASAGTAGTAGANGGAAGSTGASGSTASSPNPATQPGAGGGGASTLAARSAGATGRVIITMVAA